MTAHQRKKPAQPQPGSKKDAVLAMLRRKSGATIAELMTTTGWQAHSVRGFLSGTLKKKLSLQVATSKDEGKERRYFLKGRA